MKPFCFKSVDFLIQSNQKSYYKICDLAPTHCGSFVSNEDFNIVQNHFLFCLAKMNAKKIEVDKMMLKFERSRRFISREKQIYEKIPDFNDVIDYFIENIYVYMFADLKTKNFFKNSDLK